MNESCTVHNKTAKLALFVLVGAMMIFLVSMLTEQAYARTVGIAESANIGRDPPFTNVKGHLDAGKWVKFPTVNHGAAHGGGWAITWVTAGSGIFGGDERGWITADFGPGRTVKFSWNNPSSGPNHCLLEWTGNVNTLPSSSPFCRITNVLGAEADAKYVVSTFRITCHGNC